MLGLIWLKVSKIIDRGLWSPCTTYLKSWPDFITTFHVLYYSQDHPDYENLKEAQSKAQKVLNYLDHEDLLV